MLKIITWLNDNQGFVMSVLTCVYVLATIIIVFYNRKSINKMEKGREEEIRPYVFGNLHKNPGDICFCFKIKNYGRTGCKIVSINISPSLNFIDDNKIEEFLKDTILAPGQILQFIIPKSNKEISKNNYIVSIKYAATNNNKRIYDEKYTLITQYASQVGYTDNKKSDLSDDTTINNISNYLDTIRHII